MRTNLLLLLLLALFPLARAGDSTEENPSDRYALLPGLAATGIDVQRVQFCDTFEKALSAGDAVEAAAVVKRYHGLAADQIGRYLTAYLNRCLQEKKTLGREESPALAKALVLADHHTTISGSPLMEKMARRIEAWSFATISRWKTNDNKLAEAFSLIHSYRLSKALGLFQEAEKELKALGLPHDRACCLLLTVDVLSWLRRSSEALVILEEARPILEQTGDFLLLGQCLLKEGSLLQVSNQTSRALEKYSEAIEIFNSLGDKNSLANAGYLRALALNNAGRMGESKALLQELIAYSKSRNDDVNTCRLLGELAKVMQAEGLSDLECLAICDEGLKLTDRTNDPIQKATLLRTSGSILDSLGCHDEALTRHDEALALYRSKNLLLHAAGTQIGISECLLSMCRTEEAKEAALEALHVYETEQKGDVPPQLMASMAKLAVMEGDADGAREWAGKMEALAEKSDSPRNRTNIFQSCGTVMTAAGDYRKALDFARKSLDEALLSGAILAQGVALSHVAAAYQNLSRTDKACEYFDKSRRLLAERQDSALVISIENRYASCLVSLGRYREAGSQIVATLKKAREKGLGILEAESLELLGTNRQRRGNPTRALEAFEAARKMWKKQGNLNRECQSTLLIASAMLDLDDAEGALALLNSPCVREVTKNNPPWRFHTLGWIGIAWRMQGDPQKALDTFEDAFVVHEKIIRNLTAIPEISQGAFSGQFNRVFVNALLCCRDLHRKTGDPAFLERAHAINESRKARALLGSLSRTAVDFRPAVPAEMACALSACRRKISSLEKRMASEQTKPGNVRGEKILSWQSSLREEEGRLEEIMSRIRMEDPAYSWLNLPEPVEMGDLRSLLGEKTAWLSFALGIDGGMIIAANSDTLAVHRLTDCVGLCRKVRELLSLMTDPAFRDARRYADLARDLYLTLLEPVAEVLEGRDRIIISPEWELNSLPFGALLDKDPPAEGTITFGNLPYLILNRATAYVPSGTTLQFLAARQAKKAARSGETARFDLFAAGEIPSNASPDAVGVLAHTAREIRGIRRCFDAEKVFELSGAAATEAAFRGDQLAGARIAHIATHGLIKQGAPQHSSILLAADGDDDGLLKTFEIYELRLQADLVVLSACNTNIGKTMIGEGVYGFVRAFLYAGADAVVASNWEVRDLFTAAFMEDFYGNLHLKSKTPASPQALRQAKIDAIRGIIGRNIAESDRLESEKNAKKETKPPRRRRRTDYAHPFYWASFAHFGVP
jgi:CHAT domain-containing protein